MFLLGAALSVALPYSWWLVRGEPREWSEQLTERPLYTSAANVSMPPDARGGVIHHGRRLGSGLYLVYEPVPPEWLSKVIDRRRMDLGRIAPGEVDVPRWLQQSVNERSVAVGMDVRWPLRATWGREDHAASGIENVGWYRLQWNGATHQIPIRVRWPQLVVNGVAWCTALWCIGVVVIRWRASWRKLKGRCVRCNYPLEATMANCPECGSAIVPHHKRRRILRS